ncbi:MAG TPA: ABC transporter permease [Xanthobacteraceae bacterium]|jgi:ABC-2 type transport system permease protein|nr:ABC transporter permease [Xanthobacteraceae bacterium]
MKHRARPGFWLVAVREWRWIRHDRLAPFLIFGVPLLAYIVLVAIFSGQVIRGLGVVVVDDDRSQTSSVLIEALAASPNLKIVQRSTDLASASHAVRSGEALAAVYIPANFERDLKAERRPQVVAFYNQQPLTASGIASQGLSDALSSATAGIAPASRAAPTAPKTGTLAVQNIVLVNPERNYAQFLLRALLPMVLHVVIAISAGYAVGSEFRRRSLRTWLACAGGSPIVALAGKLAPLFAIFTVMMFLLTFIIEGLFGISFRGHAPMMIAAGLLVIVAYLALGALIQLMLRDLAAGLSVTGLIVSPAFGYAGVGFPIVGMNAFAQTWSAFLPLRWYMAVLFGQAARGLPTQASAKPFAFLAVLAVTYALLALWRLNVIGARATSNPPVEAELVIAPSSLGAGGAFAAEWRRLLTNPGLLSMMIIAPVVYGLYYPQPYLTQILRKVPIAVVDSDLSQLSRDIIDKVDGSGALSVAVRAHTLEEARQALDRGDVFAVLGIPPDAQRDVLKGNTVPLPFFADATYLFIFRATSPAIAAAIEAASSDMITRGARSDGSLATASLASSSPADILLQPIFNPVGGYASYVVPAAFILILQQTLLMGAAMVTGAALARPAAGPLRTVLGRGIAHLTMYLPALPLYLVVLPRVYGFSALGHTLELMTFAAPFILATSFMAQAAGAWFRYRETAVLLFLATSIPQLFLVGFAWPREAIPESVLAAGHIFPSDLAVYGFVRLNQMGADLTEVGAEWRGLWIMVAIYFVLAVLSARLFRWRHVNG